MFKKNLFAVLFLSLLCYCNHPTKESSESFGIFLNQNASPLLSDYDIEAYIQAEHKIVLNRQGMDKWNSYILYDSNQSPPIPVLGGGLFQKDFTVKLNNKAIYTGKFWSGASSSIYNGIVICDVLFACDSLHNWLSIENHSLNEKAIDLRNDDELINFFDSQGKLQ